MVRIGQGAISIDLPYYRGMLFLSVQPRAKKLHCDFPVLRFFGDSDLDGARDLVAVLSAPERSRNIFSFVEISSFGAAADESDPTVAFPAKRWVKDGVPITALEGTADLGDDSGQRDAWRTDKNVPPIPRNPLLNVAAWRESSRLDLPNPGGHLIAVDFLRHSKALL